MSVQSCPTLREVQSTLLRHAKTAAEQVGARLIYADIILTPRPTVWFCGTPAQGEAFQHIMNTPEVRIGPTSKGKLRRLDFSSGNPMTAVAYIHYVHNSTTIHGSSSGIEIDFCIWSEDTQSWKAPRARLESEADANYLNSLNDFCYLDVTLPILGNCHSVWKTHPARKKIDLVYTWVDGQDPAWIARKEKFKPGVTVIGSNSAARFESGAELTYSILSALRYFGDIGQIYVITDRQIPILNNYVRSKVKIIDHREVFEDKSCLPTFNSHAIEAYLHRIPNLRQYFLYVNDDVLFGRPTAACSFYDEIGRSYQFHSTAVSTPFTKVGTIETAPDAAARNNRRLLLERFGLFAFRKLKHTPFPIDRDVMREMQRQLPQAWTATVINKFRSPNDYSIAGHMYAHYAAYTGRSVVGSIRYNYYDLGAKNFRDRFSAMMRRDDASFDTFCVNDTLKTSLTVTNRAYMNEILRKIYPLEDILIRRQDIAGLKRFKSEKGLGRKIYRRKLARHLISHKMRRVILKVIPYLKNN